MKVPFRDYLFIVIGCVFLAVAVVGFLVPNQIATGGTAGLSIVFHYLFGIPTGLAMVLVNVPLLAVSVKYLGKTFAFRTILAVVLAALFVDVLAEGEMLPQLSDNTLLATLYGGLLVGIGLGLIFKAGGSAGGGTILAKIIASRTSYKPGLIIVVLDGLVIVLTAIVFKNLELALWSMIGIYVTGKVIDLMLTGGNHQKIVHISTIHPELILEEIGLLLGTSGTVLHGDDLFGKGKKEVIMVVVENDRLTALKQMIAVKDPEARLIVIEASELLGGYSKGN